MKKLGVGLGASQSPLPKIGCLSILCYLQPSISSFTVCWYPILLKGGEGKEGERTCRWTCLTIKSFMNLSCSSLSMPEGIGDIRVLILTKLVWSRCQKTAPVLHFSKKVNLPMAICLDLTLGQWWAIFQPLYFFRRICFNCQRSWNSVHQIMCPWATDKWIYWTS